MRKASINGSVTLGTERGARMHEDWRVASAVPYPARRDYPIAIVGAGGIVNDAHLPAYRKAGFQVVGIYDLVRRGMLGEVYQVSFLINVETPWNLWPWILAGPRVEVLYHSIHYLDTIR